MLRTPLPPEKKCLTPKASKLPHQLSVEILEALRFLYFGDCPNLIKGRLTPKKLANAQSNKLKPKHIYTMSIYKFMVDSNGCLSFAIY